MLSMAIPIVLLAFTLHLPVRSLFACYFCAISVAAAEFRVRKLQPNPCLYCSPSSNSDSPAIHRRPRVSSACSAAAFARSRSSTTRTLFHPILVRKWTQEWVGRVRVVRKFRLFVQSMIPWCLKTSTAFTGSRNHAASRWQRYPGTVISQLGIQTFKCSRNEPVCGTRPRHHLRTQILPQHSVFSF